MQPGPEAQPVGAAGTRIQLDARGANAVPVAWLADFDAESRELDRVLADMRRRERLAEDADLITWLALNQFAGPDYNRFAEELAKYGYAVIVAWVKKGTIFARCMERGFGGLPEPPPGALTQSDVAEELSLETVAKALHYFRENVLMKSRWNPARGASIKTYFVGQCLIQFPNIYRAWLKAEAERIGTLVDDNQLLDFLAGAHGTDPADLAIIQQEIDVRFKEISDRRLRAALVLIAAGWSQREIAERLVITEKAVERMLSYYRQRTARRGRIA
jgi:hypothetical protein